MKQLRLLLAPTALEAFLYLFCSVGVLALRSFNSILDQLLGGELGEEDVETVGSLIQSNFNNFLGIFDSTGGSATITTLLFWSAAGGVLYMVVWTIGHGFIDFYNNTAKADEMVQSQAAAKTNSVVQYGAKLLFRITSAISVVAYLVLFVRLLEPLWTEMFSNSVSILDQLNGWALLITSIIGAWFSIHLFTVFARLVTMKMRVYGEIERI